MQFCLLKLNKNSWIEYLGKTLLSVFKMCSPLIPGEFHPINCTSYEGEIEVLSSDLIVNFVLLSPRKCLEKSENQPD